MPCRAARRAVLQNRSDSRSGRRQLYAILLIYIFRVEGDENRGHGYYTHVGNLMLGGFPWR